MKLSKTLWTKLLAVGLGATMALGVGLTASRVASQEVKAAAVLTEITSVGGIVSGNSYLITANYNGTSGTEYYPIINGGTGTISTGSITAGLKSAVTTSTNLFKFTSSGANFIIQDGANYLYTTSTNNGLATKASDSNNWTAEYVSGKGFTLKYSGTSRYMTLYSNSNWRSYTSVYDYASSQNGYLHIYSVTESGASLESIALSGNLSKTAYTTADSWSPTGLTVTGTYSDSSTKTISSGITWSYSPLTPAAAGAGYNGNLTITASVSGVSDASIVKTVTVSEAPPELFISEYLEGSSNNKYIEIFNPSSATVDLTNYSLLIYANGNTSPSSTIALTGSLAKYQTYLVGNTSGTLKTPDLASGALTFNGDDAVTLLNETTSTNVDVVGIIGSTSDPGAEVTLVRNPSIIAPSQTYNASQWTSYGQDTATYLGDAENGGTILANYVMAADTANQCITKYPVAKALYLDLSTASQTYFKTTAANTRYLAWAIYHGENSTQAYQASAASIEYDSNTQNSVTAIVIIGLIGLTVAAGFYFIRKRKETF